MFLISFTPTKWTHHFGVRGYRGRAGRGGRCDDVAGDSAVPAQPDVLRRRRARHHGNLVRRAQRLLVRRQLRCAVVGSGAPDRGRRPVLVHPGAAIVTALAGLWFHFRDDFVDEQTRTRGGDHWYSKLKFAPLPVISLLMVLFMVASLAKGAYGQRDSWSWAKSNIAAFQGKFVRWPRTSW